MAASILAQDIIAICLQLAEGNIGLSMEEIIGRAENFQEEQGRHFGISHNDFRSLFLYWFIFDLAFIQPDEDMTGIKFSEIIPDILKYHYAHFNDEGAYWIKDDDTNKGIIDFKDIEYWFGIEEKNYQKKRTDKEEMKRFFDQPDISAFHPDKVRKFIEEIKISEAVLFECSRPG